MKERPILFSEQIAMPSKDPQKLKAAQDRYRNKNRDAINMRKRAAHKDNPEKGRERSRRYRKENRESVLSYNRQYSVKWRAQIKKEMIAAYGGCCECCEESEPLFMQLDHVNNDGAESRRKENANGAEYWVRLKRLGWPKDRHQLLCANCNWGRYMNDGICPHKE